MKNFIKILTLSFLLYCVPIVSMEQTDDPMKEPYREETRLDLIGGLPNELWPIVLYYVYFDKNIIDEKCSDIYEALDCIKIRLPLIRKNIRLICKTFDFIDSFRDKKLLKEDLRKFYRLILIEKFLEEQDPFKGLYPRGDIWCMDLHMNQSIGRCIGGETGYAVITKVLKFNPLLRRKLIALLLFYGADINSKDKYVGSALHYALVLQRQSYDDMKEVIDTLLAHNANVNDTDEDGSKALHVAITPFDYPRKKEITQLLIDHGADMNKPNNDGEDAIACAERVWNSRIIMN